MAKKRIDPAAQPDYDDVEPIAIDSTPDAAPVPDDRRYAVSFTLPIGVLVAVLDAGHAMADTESAIRLGLLGSGGSLTPMGKLVAGGFDATAVRHKMNAALRAAHNREVDNR